MASERREILVFSTGQRFVHWLHTFAFILLMLTGAMLYIPWFSQTVASGASGHVVRFAHRIGAICFMLVPILYVISDPRGWWADMKLTFSWGKEDLGWLKAAPRYYFLGDEGAMPPQEKFNTGQKLFYLVVVVCMVGFIVTGLIMWLGQGSVPVWVFQWSVILHDLCTIAYAAFFLIHFLLSVMHPLMKGAINGMLFGWMPEEYIKHHHAKYYEQLQRES